MCTVADKCTVTHFSKIVKIEGFCSDVATVCLKLRFGELIVYKICHVFKKYKCRIDIVWFYTIKCIYLSFEKGLKFVSVLGDISGCEFRISYLKLFNKYTFVVDRISMKKNL